MTITLELSPEEAAVLRARAQERGVGVEAVLHDLIARIGPTPAAQAGEQGAAIALMQTRRGEGATDDPEELAEREREAAEMQANVARWRAEQGRPWTF